MHPIYVWQVISLWVNCLLWVSQLHQLSLPSIRGQCMSTNPCNYMNYRSGDHYNAERACVWPQGPESLSAGMGCCPHWTPTPSVMHSAVAMFYHSWYKCWVFTFTSSTIRYTYPKYNCSCRPAFSKWDCSSYQLRQVLHVVTHLITPKKHEQPTANCLAQLKTLTANSLGWVLQLAD